MPDTGLEKSFPISLAFLYPRWARQEEACASIDVDSLFALVNIPGIDQVHLFYRARLTSDQFNPGTETIEARLFREDEIPWDEIAFRTVKRTLECFFADRRGGQFGVHSYDIL